MKSNVNYLISYGIRTTRNVYCLQISWNSDIKEHQKNELQLKGTIIQWKMTFLPLHLGGCRGNKLVLCKKEKYMNEKVLPTSFMYLYIHELSSFYTFILFIWSLV
jgi:hypothetical protein